jgi:hypothetical protein
MSGQEIGSPRPHRSPRTQKHNKRVTFAAKRMVRVDHRERGDKDELYYSPRIYHSNRVRVTTERNISKALEQKKMEIARNTPLKVTKVVEEDDGMIKLPANYKRKPWGSVEVKKDESKEADKPKEDDKDEWANTSFHDVDPSKRKGGKKRTRKCVKRSVNKKKNKSCRVNLR